MLANSNEPLKIKKKGEDGNRIISVRIGIGLLKKIDDIAKKTKYSRNELINMMLEHEVNTVQIE